MERRSVETIDLSFATEDLASLVSQCKIDKALNCDSDHLLIAVVVEWGWKAATPTRKRLWSKTNVKTLRQVVTDRVPPDCDAVELRNEDDIDTLVSSIVNALDAGIDASTPWSNPSPRSIAGFDKECKDICTEVQQLRRRWQQTRLDDDYEAYRKARNKEGRHIQRLLRNTHRQRVEDVSASKNGLWKLARWAKNQHEISPACTPALVKLDGKLAHEPKGRKPKCCVDPSSLPRFRPISRTSTDTSTLHQ